MNVLGVRYSYCNKSRNLVSLVYEKLYAQFGNLKWWPAKTPFEMMVGAVLVQNTAWRNVEKAIANFGEDLTPQRILLLTIDELIEIIRPSGFFNQKAIYLKALTVWFEGYGFSIEAVRLKPLEMLRKELLAVKGIGKETADSILLYAFIFPTFVVDAYTMRLCARLPINAGKSYDAVKEYFEANLPVSVDVYNNYHAVIVENAKKFCRKTKPLCVECPLNNVCERMGL